MLSDSLTLFRITFPTQLGEIYGKAESVFEFGLGESTFLADHLGVGRYSGVDSDSEYISTVRNKVSNYFRFYFADIGQTSPMLSPNAHKAIEKYCTPISGQPQLQRVVAAQTVKKPVGKLI